MVLRRSLGEWAGFLAISGLLCACGAAQARSPSSTATIPTPSPRVSSSPSSSVNAAEAAWINAHQG